MGKLFQWYKNCSATLLICSTSCSTSAGAPTRLILNSTGSRSGASRVCGRSNCCCWLPPLPVTCGRAEGCRDMAGKGREPWSTLYHSLTLLSGCLSSRCYCCCCCCKLTSSLSVCVFGKAENNNFVESVNMLIHPPNTNNWNRWDARHININDPIESTHTDARDAYVVCVCGSRTQKFQQTDVNN